MQRQRAVADQQVGRQAAIALGVVSNRRCALEGTQPQQTGLFRERADLRQGPFGGQCLRRHLGIGEQLGQSGQQR
ncbi:hypothetical protein D3C83_88820 [compost metagenome]